jgi:hypothetical protein
MGLLDSIPGGRFVQALVVAALAAAVIAGITWALHTYNEGLREQGRAEVRAEWNAEKLAQREVDAKETQRRLDRQGDAQRDHAAELARYQRAAADAVAARDGYHGLLDNAERLAQLASRDSATVDERQAGAAAAGMLANVSRGSDALAEVYAREADASRRAGLLCEKSYDSLIPVRP